MDRNLSMRLAAREFGSPLNIHSKNAFIIGINTYSNSTRLTPNRPPFKRQHWNIRFNKFASLRKCWRTKNEEKNEWVKKILENVQGGAAKIEWPLWWNRFSSIGLNSIQIATYSLILISWRLLSWVRRVGGRDLPVVVFDELELLSSNSISTTSFGLVKYASLITS